MAGALSQLYIDYVSGDDTVARIQIGRCSISDIEALALDTLFRYQSCMSEFDTGRDTFDPDFLALLLAVLTLRLASMSSSGWGSRSKEYKQFCSACKMSRRRRLLEGARNETSNSFGGGRGASSSSTYSAYLHSSLPPRVYFLSICFVLPVPC